MKVIILKDTRGVGRCGDVKEVPNGYARNFLLPRKLAKAATEEALNEMKSEKENLEKHIEALKLKLAQIQSDLNKNPLIFKVKVGDGDKVFGSIGKKDIEQKLAGLESETMIEVHLIHPVKTLGEKEVEISLGSEVKGKIKIRLEKE